METEQAAPGSARALALPDLSATDGIHLAVSLRLPDLPPVHGGEPLGHDLQHEYEGDQTGQYENGRQYVHPSLTKQEIDGAVTNVGRI